VDFGDTLNDLDLMLNEIEGIKPKPKEIFKPIPIPALHVAPIKAEPFSMEPMSKQYSKRHIPGQSS